MSPRLNLTNNQYRSFPRVSGDEPWLSFLGFGAFLFSPRERG